MHSTSEGYEPPVRRWVKMGIPVTLWGYPCGGTFHGGGGCFCGYPWAVPNMQSVELKDFTPHLRARHVSVWQEMAQLDPCAVTRKLACYKHWMALPLRSRFLSSRMLPLPKYLCLNLSRHNQCNFSCFRLRAHRAAVETDCWRHIGEHQICSCGCAERQDKKHVLLACRFPRVCTLRDTT